MILSTEALWLAEPQMLLAGNLGLIFSFFSIGLQLYLLVRGPKQQKGQFGPRIDDSSIMDSALGIPLPIGYGTIRLAGNVIWAGGLIEVATEEGGGDGKAVAGGAPSVTTFTYFRSFAVAFAQPAGTNAKLLKIFADGKLIFDATGTSGFQKEGVVITVHEGDESQLVDALIDSKISNTKLPAFRGTFYIVFDELPLADFGNRIPNVAALITFQGTNQFLLTTVATTHGTPKLWAYNKKLQKAYYIRDDDAVAGDIIVTEYDLTNDTTRTVTSSAASTDTGIQASNGQLYDGQCIDSHNFIYVSAAFFGFARLLKIDPTTLEIFDEVDLDELNNIFSFALACYVEPRSGTQTTEAILCGFSNGKFRWVDVTDGRLALHGNSATLDGGSVVNDTGALQMIVTRDNSIWAITGKLATGIDTPRVLSRITPGTVNTVTSDPSFPHIDTDFSATMTSMRAMIYDRFNDGLIVFNDTSDQAEDLPNGEGWMRLDISTDPPTVTATKSFFVDGVYQPGLNKGAMMQQGAERGQFVFATPTLTSDNIFLVDAITLEIITVYDAVSWGLAALNQIGFWDINGNSWLTVETGGNIRRLFLDRVQGSHIDLDDLVTDICLRSGLTASQIDVTDLNPVVDARNIVRGYALTRPTTGAAALQQLAAAYFFDGVESDFILKFRRRGGTAVESGVTIPEIDLGVAKDKPLDDWVKIQRVQPFEIPLKYTVKFFDINADYQISSAPAQRSVSPLAPVEGQHQQEVDFPIVFNSTEAKQLAERLLYTAHTENIAVEASTFPRHMTLDATDHVAIHADGETFNIRIDGLTLGESFAVNLKGSITDPETYISTDAAGQEITGVDGQVLVPTKVAQLYVMDISLLRDNDDSLQGIPVYFAFGDLDVAWSGGVVRDFRSGPGLREILTMFGTVPHGVAATVLPDTDHWATWDRDTTLTVNMIGGTLVSVTEAEVLDGQNAALLGDEVIQYVTATDNGDGSWDLSTLLRARRGSDWAVGTHFKGERFVKLKKGVEIYEFETDEFGVLHIFIGQSFRHRTREFPPIPQVIEGNAVKPLSATSPRRVLNASDDAYITWLRRTRTGGAIDWLDARHEMKLGETTAEFEVDLVDANDSAVVSDTKNSTATEFKKKGTVSVADSGAGKMRVTIAGADFTADGFVAGKIARLEAFAKRFNRGVFEIDAVGTTTIDFVNPDFEVESSTTNAILIQMTEQVKFIAAEQTAAGYTAGDPLTVRIYQFGQVGRGFPLEVTL